MGAAVERPLRVTLFHAEGCHLCERAREVLDKARVEVPFELEEVDIGGREELEAKYREWLPVVEIDGERAFVYFVDRDSLVRRLKRSSAGDTKAAG
jgi:glutaredoxin